MLGVYCGALLRYDISQHIKKTLNMENAKIDRRNFVNTMAEGYTKGGAYYSDLIINLDKIVGFVFVSNGKGGGKHKGCYWTLDGLNMSVLRDKSGYYDLNVNTITKTK